MFSSMIGANCFPITALLNPYTFHSGFSSGVPNRALLFIYSVSPVLSHRQLPLPTARKPAVTRPSSFVAVTAVASLVATATFHLLCHTVLYLAIYKVSGRFLALAPRSQGQNGLLIYPEIQPHYEDTVGRDSQRKSREMGGKSSGRLTIRIYELTCGKIRITNYTQAPCSCYRISKCCQPS